MLHYLRTQIFSETIVLPSDHPQPKRRRHLVKAKGRNNTQSQHNVDLLQRE